MDRFEPWQKLKTEQPAEGESHFALPMRVDVIFLDLHFCIMAQQAFDHRRDFGRGTGFQLGVDAGRVLLNMPVNHDALTAVAYVPLCHEVLIPGAELFGIRSAGRRRLTPDMRQSDPKHAVDDLGNGFAERLLADETSTHIDQIGVVFRSRAAAYAL